MLSVSLRRNLLILADGHEQRALSTFEAAGFLAQDVYLQYLQSVPFIRSSMMPRTPRMGPAVTSTRMPVLLVWKRIEFCACVGGFNGLYASPVLPASLCWSKTSICLGHPLVRGSAV